MPDSATATRRFPFFAAGLAGLLGLALQLQQAALWHAWGYGALLVCAAPALGAVRWRDLPGPMRYGFTVVACLLLGFASTGLRAQWYASKALDPALEGRDLLVIGVIEDLPQRSDIGLRFRLRVREATLQGTPVTLPAKLDLGWYGGVYAQGAGSLGLQRQPQAVRAGEMWRMVVRIKAPHGGRNPHGFDYELWLWEQGVGATGYVRAGPQDPSPQRLEQTWQQPVDQLRQHVRDAIFASVEPASTAGLLAALVVGDQRAVEPVDWDVFRATGITHLMSISGLHITMFAWAAALLVGALWRRSAALCAWFPAPSAAVLGGMALAVAYAVFSGWGLPAQRTCLMLATVGLLRLRGLAWPWPHVCLLACVLVLAWDPWALLQPGFWLSFVAVCVLIATSAPPLPAQAAPTGMARRSVVWLADLARVQGRLTVALAPLTLLFFGQVSVVGLLANLFAIPWVTLVVTPLSLLGVVVPGVWGVAAGAIDLMVHALRWLATWPVASMALPMAPAWAGVLGTLGAALLVMSLPWYLRVWGLPLVLPILLWQTPGPAPGHFALLAADVGQGNAVLVRTARHALLYDAGPRYSMESDAGERVLVPLMQALQLPLDRVLLSHRDADHTGGAVAVLGMQPSATVLSSIEADHPLQALRAVQRCEAGQVWDWDGVRFEILHPRAQDYPSPSSALPRPNTLSCVLRISAGQHAALLAGDIEAAQEAALVQRGAPLRADLLLVPHHGSKTSSTDVFLDAVQPRFAWVQSGYRNRFGHPAAPVLQRYQARNVVVHDSPRCGAMAWSTEAPDGVDCTRVVQQRYWHHRLP
jgi:competence protein ComEC